MARMSQAEWERLRTRKHRTSEQRLRLVEENQAREKDRWRASARDYDARLKAIRKKHGGCPINFVVNLTSHGHVGHGFNNAVDFYKTSHGSWAVVPRNRGKPHLARSQAAALRIACRLWRAGRK
jgi:hypothetical protein